MTNQHVKNRIMADLIDEYPGLIKPGKAYVNWANDPSNPLLDKRKTLAMRMVESHFGEPIEQLLSTGKKGVDIARLLTLSPSTVARWRQRLGLTRPYRQRMKNGNDY